MTQHNDKPVEHQSPKHATVPAEYTGDFKAFNDALTKAEASFRALSTGADALKPPDDPLDLDKTRGIREATAMLIGARAMFDEILRWISPGPGGGVGGITKDAQPKSVPAEAPPPSAPRAREK